MVAQLTLVGVESPHYGSTTHHFSPMPNWDATTWTAVYGAVVSTIGLTLSIILAIWQILRERRKLKVTCNFAFATPIHDKAMEFVTITAVNVGHRPITVVEAGLRMGAKMTISQMDNKTFKYPLPKKLEDGENVIIYFDYDVVHQAFEELRKEHGRYGYAFVRDAENRVYKGKLPQILKDRGIA